MLESRCKILNHLKSDEVVEGGTAVLRVAISKPRAEAFWFRSGQPMKTGGRYKVEVGNGDLLHSLTIEAVSMDDSGEFAVTIDDGVGDVVTSSCKIAVKGINMLQPLTIDLFT